MKFDLKNIVIGVLVVLLIAFYIGAQKGYIGDEHKTEIEKLHTENTSLLTVNDSLKNANHELDMQIGGLEHLAFDLNTKNDSLSNTIYLLGKKRNEIPTKINRMSANGVADAFTNYLDKKDKSRNASH